MEHLSNGNNRSNSSRLRSDGGPQAKSGSDIFFNDCSFLRRGGLSKSSTHAERRSAKKKLAIKSAADRHLLRIPFPSGGHNPMFEASLKSVWNAIKSGVIAALIWTCVFSAILWFFSKPTIPYLNFVSILAPYAMAFFGTAALVVEALNQWIASDVMKCEGE
jgi:hypothetical protein